MTDYIKREDAIDYLTTNMNWFDADGIETSEEEKRADITELVNGVSSADVAPVRHEEDGTLWVTVGDCETVGRVIVRNEQGHFCRVFYMGDGDEEPVRHGHWEVIDAEEPRRYGCSECKRLSWHMENYCPNCGAKMDGGNE